MDFESLFYVLLAVIYFLSRILKSRKQQPQQPQQETQTESPKKPVSFEDLLKEFGVEGEKNEPEEEVEEEMEAEPAEDERPRSYRSQYSDEEAKSIFEKSIKEAEKAVDEPEPEKRMIFKEFKPYRGEEESNEFAKEIKEMLKSEDGAKKSIVLREILSRKY